MNQEEVPALSTSAQPETTGHLHRRKRRRSRRAKQERVARWVLFTILQVGTLVVAFIIWYLVARV